VSEKERHPKRVERRRLEPRPFPQHELEALAERARSELWTPEQVGEALAMLHPDMRDEADKPAA
jgi:hypothetical protein